MANGSGNILIDALNGDVDANADVVSGGGDISVLGGGNVNIGAGSGGAATLVTVSTGAGSIASKRGRWP